MVLTFRGFSKAERWQGDVFLGMPPAGNGALVLLDTREGDPGCLCPARLGDRLAKQITAPDLAFPIMAFDMDQGGIPRFLTAKILFPSS